jgi:hypothetical protein
MLAHMKASATTYNSVFGKVQFWIFRSLLRAIFLLVWDANLKEEKEKGGKKRKKYERRKEERKEEGIEAIELIIQCPGSANDFGILVFHYAPFMLHCRHHEQQSLDWLKLC